MIEMGADIREIVGLFDVKCACTLESVALYVVIALVVDVCIFIVFAPSEMV